MYSSVSLQPAALAICLVLGILPSLAQQAVQPQNAPLGSAPSSSLPPQSAPAPSPHSSGILGLSDIAIATIAPDTAAPADDAASSSAEQPLLLAPAPLPDDYDLLTFEEPCPADYQLPPMPQMQCSSTFSVGVSHNASSGCISERLASYYSLQEYPKNTRVVVAETAEECCDACARSVVNKSSSGPNPTCNVWNWCGNPSGCCTRQEGCPQDGDLFTSMIAYMTCTLKFVPQFNESQAYLPNATHPLYRYNATDVLQWPLWEDHNGTEVTSACKSLTSGIAVDWLKGTNLLPTPEDATALQGIDIPQFGFGCNNDSHPAKYNDFHNNACYLAGNLNATTRGCLLDPLCSGLVQLDWACNGRPVREAPNSPIITCKSAYLKNFPTSYLDKWEQSGEAYPDCVAVAPYLSTYLFPSRKAPPAPPAPAEPSLPTAPVLPPPRTPGSADALAPAPAPRISSPGAVGTSVASSSSSSSNTGAIAGGVVGGVVALVLGALAFAFFLRRKGSRWHLIGKEKKDPPEPILGSATLPDSTIRNASDDIVGEQEAGVADEALLTGNMFYVPSTPDWEEGYHFRASTRQPVDWSGGSKKTALLTDNSDSSGLEMPVLNREDDAPNAASGALKTMTSPSVRGPTLSKTSKFLPMEGDQERVTAEWLINPVDLKIAKDAQGRDQILGTGAFGVVYKALRGGVEPVAVKLLKGKQDARAQAQFMREVELLRTARHPNIVLYLGACIAEGKTLLVTELMTGGDLWTQLSRIDNSYTWYKRGSHVAMDVAQGLFYLHSYNTLHLDIKSGNVLLSRDGTAKVSDVGLAKIMQHSQYTNVGAQGTWAWSAPEVFLGRPCTTKADIYSYGVLLWEICSSDIPARGRMRAIEVPQEAPQAIVDLIADCMEPDPKARPDMRQVIAKLDEVSIN